MDRNCCTASQYTPPCYQVLAPMVILCGYITRRSRRCASIKMASCLGRRKFLARAWLQAPRMAALLAFVLMVWWLRGTFSSTP